MARREEREEKEERRGTLNNFYERETARANGYSYNLDTFFSLIRKDKRRLSALRQSDPITFIG